MSVYCPRCMWQPAEDSLWECDRCRKKFHAFKTRGECPSCFAISAQTRCPECGGVSKHDEWHWTPRCPKCGWEYLGEEVWNCTKCPKAFDPFETGGACPACGTHVDPRCPECAAKSAFALWIDRSPPEEPDPPEFFQAIAGSPTWNCPPGEGIVPDARFRWIVTRLAWLIDKRGIADLVDRSQILPTGEYFPDANANGADALRRLFSKLLEYAGLDALAIELEFSSDAQEDPERIYVDPEGLAQPERLRAQLCRQIGQYWISRQIGLDGFPVDAYALAELATVYLGFGALIIPDSWDPFRLMPRVTTLSADELLVALALILGLQGRSHQTFAPYLRPSHAAALGRFEGFLLKHPEVFQQLKAAPAKILEGIVWVSS